MNQDRTRTALRSSATCASPAPMPGRLPVDFDTPLGLNSKPLNDVPTGTDVEVTARIVNSKTLAGGRVALVIGDHNGNTAMVSMRTADVMTAYRVHGGPIKAGQMVIVRGTVARRTPALATIDGRAMRAVTR
ncbi:hypothetical protein ACH4GZ_38525 [Streptomyces hygroscopicus]|uniref:hypothetical protein n=1 Tax=Streptomyces hygroscopicus TaxID=1912 RepID=UPI003795D7EF